MGRPDMRIVDRTEPPFPRITVHTLLPLARDLAAITICARSSQRLTILLARRLDADA